MGAFFDPEKFGFNIFGLCFSGIFQKISESKKFLVPEK